jgi:hypothetical protein
MELLLSSRRPCARCSSSARSEGAIRERHLAVGERMNLLEVVVRDGSPGLVLNLATVRPTARQLAQTAEALTQRPVGLNIHSPVPGSVSISPRVCKVVR